jgi:integrase
VSLSLDFHQPTRKPGPRKPSTVNRLKVTISSMFTYAQRQVWIDSNPARRVAQMKLAGQRCRLLSDEERGRLLEACRKSDWDRMYLLVLLALTTGARKSELTHLRWSD